MSMSSSSSFPKLLGQLAAEHDRLCEVNRGLAARVTRLEQSCGEGDVVGSMGSMGSMSSQKSEKAVHWSSGSSRSPRLQDSHAAPAVAVEDRPTEGDEEVLVQFPASEASENRLSCVSQATEGWASSPFFQKKEAEPRVALSVQEAERPSIFTSQEGSEHPDSAWQQPARADSAGLADQSCGIDSALQSIDIQSGRDLRKTYIERAPLLSALGPATVKLARDSRWTINPEHSRFLERWDKVTIFALGFVAIVCPLQICIINDPSFNWLFVVNCLVDFIFFVDMWMQFLVMYPKDTTYGRILENRPRLIALHYLKTWFAIDFLSVAPFDLVNILSNKDGDQSNHMSKMKVVKIIRLLRLIKLMRIIRASRLFKRFESRMTITYKQLALRFFLMLLVITHWMANLWALTLVLVEEGEGVPRWVDVFDALERNVTDKTRYEPWKLYVASVYFTSYTLTSVGYGDIGPKNIVERVVCTVMLVISGTSWAVVLGQVSGIVAKMDEDEQYFRKSMDELNAMMRERSFPAAMRQRLRHFFLSNKSAQRRTRHQQNMLAVSSGLRGEVAIQINKLWISKVSLLQHMIDMSETARHGRLFHIFVVDVCLALQSEAHAQSDLFGLPNVLYILSRGLVSRPPRLLMQGAAWGADFVLMDRTLLLEPCESLAMTYVELLVLSRQAFFDTVDRHKKRCPQIEQEVRRMYCWLAFQCAIRAEAKRRQKKQRRDKRRQEAQEAERKWRGSMDEKAACRCGEPWMSDDSFCSKCGIAKAAVEAGECALDAAQMRGAAHSRAVKVGRPQSTQSKTCVAPGPPLQHDPGDEWCVDNWFTSPECPPAEGHGPGIDHQEASSSDGFVTSK